ncbi:MAG TPA: methylmalonyl-CoA mutase [Flavobacteriaceae bacterium]|nr:methylmalonyl-CoA mutase [Flavobacteriaceae bacterium]HBR54658.1 methylmalonyl-CoA mutase [Flavobacteriaceae bacterium]
MSNSLFKDFDPVSAKQWKQKIQADLKGADYNDALVWQSLEGVHVRPTYHADDFEATPTTIPGHPEQWSITQEIYIDDAAIANRLALDAAERGAEAILFTVENRFDLETVFKNFPFSTSGLYIDWKFLDEAFISDTISYLKEKNATVYHLIDVLGNLASSGNWFHNSAKDHTLLETLTKKFPDQHLISVSTSVYQNAGANMVQQLAYGLAHANEYLNHFDPSEQNASPPITFTVAVGSNYFFEIAKIRALRMLFASLASAYNTPTTCHIIALPSRRNKTLYDYNVNMLRTTTECMAATLGGANSVCNLPYDALYHKSNEFGERIARNQLLILKNESYFDAVSNPADGSYYIETLTNQLAEKALELFKSIEKGGGLLSQLKEGTLQKKIKESAQKEQDWFDEGKIVLLGTNKYPNKADQMKHDLELFPFVKTNKRKTEIAPIIAKRLSENVEQERLSHE